MFSKKNTILSIIIIVLALVILQYIATRVYSFRGNKIEKISINDKTFYAEVVSSNEKLQKGLGERKNLCDSCAMLFKFPESGKYSFWMKGMRFPLDIIWLNQGYVVHIEKNVSENFSGILSSSADADSVLEINAGTVDKSGIKTGDDISL